MFKSSVKLIQENRLDAFTAITQTLRDKIKDQLDTTCRAVNLSSLQRRVSIDREELREAGLMYAGQEMFDGLQTYESSSEFVGLKDELKEGLWQVKYRIERTDHDASKDHHTILTVILVPCDNAAAHLDKPSK